MGLTIFEYFWPIRLRFGCCQRSLHEIHETSARHNGRREKGGHVSDGVDHCGRHHHQDRATQTGGNGLLPSSVQQRWAKPTCFILVNSIFSGWMSKNGEFQRMDILGKFHFQVGKTNILAMPTNVLDIPDPQGDHLLVPNDQQPFGGESRGWNYCQLEKHIVWFQDVSGRFFLVLQSSIILMYCIYK